MAIEGKDGHGFASNCFISFRGQLTKCPVEHVRKASSLESIASGSWEAAIEEVISAAQNDAVNREDEQNAEPLPEDERPLPVVATSSPLTPAEVVAAISPPAQAPSRDAPSAVGSGIATPLPEGVAQAVQRTPFPQATAKALARTLERAREFDEGERGTKRPAEDDLPREDGFARPSTSGELRPSEATAFEALVLDSVQLECLANSSTAHPLVALQAQVDLDRWSSLEAQEQDHGTWDGRWAFICERDWNTIVALGLSLPCGEEMHESYAAQAARKEYAWSKMSATDKKLWGDAAVSGWQVYIDNAAVQVLSLEESARVRKDLAKRNELDRILRPRFVLTDKHDGLRTASHPLPVKPSSRLVVPGYQDRSNLTGQLRRDAPTGSRIAQHFLFSVAAYHTWWSLISSDVKLAFLKGDPYMDRELYVTNTNPATSSSLPLKPGQLCRVLKGIFGLADAPREWWLRLSRSMEEHKWCRSTIDAAMWTFWQNDADKQPVLEGLIVAHVDDLLFTGSPTAEASLAAIGQELGFGSQDRGDFTWCGKRIRRASDGTVRLSMREYHQNLEEIHLPKNRKSDPGANLSAFEARQLRAALGSLQWLTAQVRFDMSYGVSTLQGENPPTIGTITRVNSLIREFKRTGDFELVFRPVDYRTAGIVAISDAALGNVQRSGAGIGSPLEKVYSQAGYVILLGDKDLVRGQHGRFNIIDCRSHRISRVCRSTYSAETLSAEESIDVGQLCRGFLASLWGKNVIGKAADRATSTKDVHDKGNSDTPSFGSQKSLAFTIGWLRAILRRPHTALKWTATSNMWIDALTKDMDLTRVRRIMSAGEWSVSYSPEFARQVSKTKKAKPSDDPASAELPGERLNGDDPLLPHLARLADRKGWHFISNIGVQVAHSAKSFRTPEPRFSAVDLPLRSSFGRFCVNDQYIWRCLESGTRYGELTNQSWHDRFRDADLDHSLSFRLISHLLDP